MSQLPLTRTELHLRFAALRRVDWALIERRLAAALVRERAGSVVPDGYPSGGGNGRSSGAVADPTGRVATDRLSDAIWLKDAHRKHTLKACAELDALMTSFNRLEGHLTQITRLINPNEARMPDCVPCAAAGVHHTSIHWGTVGGRLAEPTHVCAKVYEFVRRHHRLPTSAEASNHDRTGRWRVRTAPPDRRPRWRTKT